MRKAMHSLREMVEKINPTRDVIDYTIHTKHNYLVLLNKEFNSKTVIPVDKYKSIEFNNGTYILYTTEPIEVGCNKPVDEFELDFSNGYDDILGFDSYDDILSVYRKSELNRCEKVQYKLIFSPQLAKYLVKQRYKITDLKERNDGSNDTVFVFLVEDGFYQTIKEFKEKENK